jgi:ribonuclease-3
MVQSESAALLKRNVKKLQNKLGIKFKREYTLMIAITRRSYKNENKYIDRGDNERLEFLGDSVLKLLLSEHLYNNSSDPEGQMTKIR